MRNGLAHQEPLDTDWARLDGIAAFERGDGVWTNPHLPRSDSWRSWYRGFVGAGLSELHVARRRAVLEAELEAARQARRRIWLFLSALAGAPWLAAWLHSLGWLP